MENLFSTQTKMKKKKNFIRIVDVGNASTRRDTECIEYKDPAKHAHGIETESKGKKI